VVARARSCDENLGLVPVTLVIVALISVCNRPERRKVAHTQWRL